MQGDVRLWSWSISVAVAGFLFGFDTAVISGADRPVQALWHTGPLLHGLLVMSSALWGTVIGALAGNLPCDRFGRRRTLIGIGILYLASAIGSALAPDPYSFSVLRFIGGLGVGASSVAVPAYIAEIAPPARRGRLVALYQLQIVCGILVAYFSNYLLDAAFALDWRWMLGVEALPAAVFVALVMRIPESPRWLLLQGRESEARDVIETVDPGSAGRVIEEIRSSAAVEPAGGLLQARCRRPVTLAFLIALFNQLSGINFVIYFAPRIFAMAGLDDSAALLSTVGIGLTNLAFTLLGLVLIDRAGRRSLMLAGSLGYILSLSGVTWAFATGAGGLPVAAFLFLFIAAHAVGQGAVIWVFIAEIFPNRLRSRGQSLGSGTHWVLAAGIALLVPAALERFAASEVFGFFALMTVLQLLFVLLLMPETRGRSLENLAGRLTSATPPHR